MNRTLKAMKRIGAMRTILVAVLAVFTLAGCYPDTLVQSQSPSTAEAAARPHVKVTWIGGPTMVIEFGTLTIMTDPVLGKKFKMGDPNQMIDPYEIITHRRLTPLCSVSLESVDLILLSHAHPDHFNEKAQATLNRTLPIILPVADIGTVEEMGFGNLYGMRWGETQEFDAGIGRVKITATIAHHSPDPQTAKTLGRGNGYWIEFIDGSRKFTLYWTGDTFPTTDVIEAIASLGEPDLMAPDVGGVGSTGFMGQISMGAAEVIAFAAEIQPTWLLPIHHSTFGFYIEPISKLVAKSIRKPYRLVIAECTTTVYDLKMLKAGN